MTKDQNNRDHPDWTAFALGELSPEELQAFEQELENNADAQAFIQDTQDLASLLSEEFAQEPPAQLKPEKRQAIFAAKDAPAKDDQAMNFNTNLFLKIAVPLSLAASVALFLMPQISANRSAPMDMASKSMEKASGKARYDDVAIRQNVALAKRQMEAEQMFHRAKMSPAKVPSKGMPMDPSADMAMEPSDRPDNQPQNPSQFDQIQEKPFTKVSDDPRSTFSVDVDTASYSTVRRYLKHNSQVPQGIIRAEELINYFPYDYTPPADGQPFAADLEVAPCPWNTKNRLVRIGIKGRVIENSKRPASNLVFLLDVSGSMGGRNRLPLLKQGVKLMLQQLGEGDRVAIVVYAGAAGLVLPSTSCDKQNVILNALDKLQAGGSTNGGQGIDLAYRIAVENFIEGGTNRILLATDGDFNVGVSSRGGLIDLIREKSKTGVFLTVLGFGMSNRRDSMLEQIADKGNGQYAFIDSEREAKKVLVEQMSGTLVTIAKDVKLQVEFNPMHVDSYRLIGYENRMLAHQDFNNDKKDAGEIGAGHTVTAFYELVIADGSATKDKLKYQKKALKPAADSRELLTLKIRYKEPEAKTSKLLTFPIEESFQSLSQASGEFKFAAAVAGFALKLRKSPHAGNVSFGQIWELGHEGLGKDKAGYRKEFLELVKTAQGIYEKRR